MTVTLEGHITLFGGSFNPPHIGHQMACLYLLEALGAPEVWLIPTHRHAFGKKLAPFSHRMEMCKLLAAPFAPRIRVLDVEAHLHAQGRTYIVLQHLMNQHPKEKFAHVIGADLLAETPRWYRWDELRSMVRWVVLGRGGYSSTGEVCPIDLPKIASSAVRQAVQSGRDIAGLVPLTVKNYIQQHQLYRSATPSCQPPSS